MLGLEHELSDIDNAGNGTRLLCSFGRNDDRVWRGGSTTRYAGSGTLPPAAERVNAWLTAAVKPKFRSLKIQPLFACRICVQNGEPTTASDAVEFRAAGVAECE